MIKLFQRDMTLQAVLIVIAMLLLWGQALLAPSPMNAGAHPAVLYGMLCHWLAPAPRLAVIIAMLLALACGVMLNLLLSNVGLVSQNSLLPTLLYLIATATAADTLTPLLLVSGVAIAVLHPLMLRGTLLTIPSEKICSATALIGIATLFYTPAVFLLLSYILIALNYRLYSWKDWMLMLLGFAAPYVLLVLVLYMTDGLAPWWEGTVASLSELGFAMKGAEATTWTILGSLLLAAVFLWSLVTAIGHNSEHTVVWQRNATTVMLFTAGGIGMMFCATLLPLAMTLFAIPFVFCTYRMLTAFSESHSSFGHRKKHLWIYDLLLILILIAALLC